MNLDLDFTVTEGFYLSAAKGQAEIFTDFFCSPGLELPVKMAIPSIYATVN
jgi:hypothetical protein